MALGLVSRTAARHDGQVNRGGFDDPEEGGCRGRVACQENHSLRHEPQKVWRQSRRVRGW